MARLVLLLLAFPWALTAQSRSTPPARGDSAHRRTNAAPAAVPDPQIEASIRGKFAKSKIAADKFTVRVQGGVATLEGRTDVLQHKGTATRLARSAGASAVVNKIEVSQAARDKANRNLAKGRRRVQVKRGEPRSSQ